MMRHTSTALLLLTALTLVACHAPSQHFDKDVKLGGKTVSAAVLNKGGEDYTLYCRQCHGDKGDGMGASSPGLRPPPRDFRQAQFKFGWVTDGLPHDDDLSASSRVASTARPC